MYKLFMKSKLKGYLQAAIHRYFLEKMSLKNAFQDQNRGVRGIWALYRFLSKTCVQNYLARVPGDPFYEG